MISFKRRVGAHVEQEDSRWQVAANLILDFESVSSSFVGAALCPKLEKLSESEKRDLGNKCLHASEYTLLLSFEKLISWASKSASGLLLNATHPESFILGFHDALPSERLYRVSEDYISIHIPLHRFISKIVLFAACSNIPLSLSKYLEQYSGALTPLVEYPMCCLALSSQVQLGMWRRNGSSVANLAYNYTRSPLCRSLRDADLVAVQTGIIGLGPGPVVALATRRYEVTALLALTDDDIRTGSPALSPKLKEYWGASLAELLRTFIMIVTHVPSTLASNNSNPTIQSCIGKDPLAILPPGAIVPLAREVAHLLLSGVQKVSGLQAAKGLIGREDTVGDADMDMIIETLCIRRIGAEGEPKILELKSEVYELFDPEFPHLSQHQLQVTIKI